jgi:pyruvate carboxylase subunit B
MDKYDEVLAEIPKVRKDLGYPPLVTPTSQIVGTQAVLNVITGDRYKMVPKEVKDYVKGLYGKSPAMIDPKVRLKVLCEEEPITVRPADLLAPEYEKAKRELDSLNLAKQDEDYLTYALYPQVALKFLQGAAVEEQLIKKPPVTATHSALKAEPIALNVEIDGESYLVKVAPAGMTIEEAKPKAPKDGLTVPMQGVIIRYMVKKGDKVAEGDAVAVVEAMKMEQNILANKNGTVKEIYIKEGTTVTPGDILMTIE